MFDWIENITPAMVAQAMALTMMVMGLVTLLVPILPGLVIIWLAALGYGIYSGFGLLGGIMFGIMTVLMVGGSFVDNFLMGTQAHREGASWISIVLALIAAILGNLALPIIGGLLAALLVLFAVEWIRRKNWREALIALKGLVVGCGWAIVIRFIIGLVMIGLWIIWAWS